MNAAHHFRLGLFIIGAVVTLIIVLTVMGTGTLLRPSTAMETYIDGSIQGLDVGAPIKFRGVNIGEVTNLTFTSVEYQADVPPVERKRYVMVEGRLRPERFASNVRESMFSEALLEPFIERGLRIRMAAQGITGINYLELDFLDPDAHPALPIAWEPENVYIPSAPSIATQFIEYAERVLRRIDLLDIEGVIDSAISLMVTLERTASGFDTHALSRQGEELLEQMRLTVVQSQQVMQTAEQLLQGPDTQALAGETRATLQAVRQTLEQADIGRLVAQVEAILERMDRGLEINEQTLTETLNDLQAATTSLRSLSEDARRDPAGAIFGSPPPRSTIERNR